MPLFRNKHRFQQYALILLAVSVFNGCRDPRVAPMQAVKVMHEIAACEKIVSVERGKYVQLEELAQFCPALFRDGKGIEQDGYTFDLHVSSTGNEYRIYSSPVGSKFFMSSRDRIVRRSWTAQADEKSVPLK